MRIRRGAALAATGTMLRPWSALSKLLRHHAPRSPRRTSRSWASMLEAELLRHVLRARFRVAFASVDQAPAEKVTDVDDEWFRGHASSLDLLYRILSRLQPFGVAVVQLVGIREQLLDARPVSFAIPGDAHHHAGTGLLR